MLGFILEDQLVGRPRVAHPRDGVTVREEAGRVILPITWSEYQACHDPTAKEGRDSKKSCWVTFWWDLHTVAR